MFEMNILKIILAIVRYCRFVFEKLRCNRKVYPVPQPRILIHGMLILNVLSFQHT